MSPRPNETTLEWCKRRAGEEHTFAVEYSDDEADARAKVFDEIARRLGSEYLFAERLDNIAAKAQAEADAQPNAARRSYCEGQAAMARTIAGILRGGK